MSIKEQSLTAALSAVRLKDLPAPLREGDGYWIEALALVRKRDMSESYCLVRRGGNGLLRYVRDFGNLSPIVTDNKERGIYGLIRLYPCEFLDERYVPKSDSAIRNLLRGHYEEGEVHRIMGLPAAEREIIVIDTVIAAQRGAVARSEAKYEPEAVEALIEQQLALQDSGEAMRDESGVLEAVKDANLDDFDNKDTKTTKRKTHGRKRVRKDPS